MAWNYRIVEKNGYLAVYETYYDDKEKAISISEDAVSPEADSLHELKDTLELMLEALEKEVLHYSSFE